MKETCMTMGAAAVGERDVVDREGNGDESGRCACDRQETSRGR